MYLPFEVPSSVNERFVSVGVVLTGAGKRGIMAYTKRSHESQDEMRGALVFTIDSNP